MIKRVHVFISGRVQGVFFRARTKDEAQELGLSGWVKNTPEGQVEAVFEGSEERIKKIIKWCRTGSPTAQVTKVVFTKEEPQNLKDFQIKY